MSYISRNDCKLYYELQGEWSQATRPIVVVLNGIMMDTAHWRSLAMGLKQKYRVVLTDFRGQGLSDKPDGNYTFDDHVADLMFLLEELGIKEAHFVGTSYGGEVGLHFAIQYPEVVRSLVIAASVSEVDALLKAKVHSWRIAARHALQGFKTDFLPLVLPFNYSPAFLAENESKFAARAEKMAKTEDDWFRAFDSLCGCFETLALTESLSGVRAPTLIVAGTQDELKPPRFARLMASRIAHSNYVEIDAGHALVAEKADEFLKLVLEHLERHSESKRE